MHSSEWVERFSLLLSCPLEDAKLDQYFIWLAGIISDLPQHIDKNLSVFRKLKIPNKDLRQSIETLLSKNSQMREHCLKVLECRELVKDIMSAITAQEASRVMYFRNYYSHPVLDGYKIILSYNGNSVAFDSKKYTTYLKNHPGDQVELYTETRKRISKKTAELNSLQEKLFELRY